MSPDHLISGRDFRAPAGHLDIFSEVPGAQSGHLRALGQLYSSHPDTHSSMLEGTYAALCVSERLIILTQVCVFLLFRSSPLAKKLNIPIDKGQGIWFRGK